MVINMMEAKHLMPFFFLGFVVAAISQLNLVALGIVGVVSAVIYIQLILSSILIEQQLRWHHQALLMMN